MKMYSLMFVMHLRQYTVMNNITKESCLFTHSQQYTGSAWHTGVFYGDG